MNVGWKERCKIGELIFQTKSDNDYIQKVRLGSFIGNITDPGDANTRHNKP